MSRKKKGGSVWFYCGFFIILIVASIISFQIFPIEAQSLIIAVGAILILYMVISGQSAIIMDDLQAQRRVAEPRDSSVIQRVIVESYSGKEHIISASPETSFRDACRNDWIFSSVEMNKAWIIQDERGNDISNTPLSQYHGISRLISVEPMDYRQPHEDEMERMTSSSEHLSDSDMGVKFYD